MVQKPVVQSRLYKSAASPQGGPAISIMPCQQKILVQGKVGAQMHFVVALML